jgi:hypothetical protein
VCRFSHTDYRSAESQPPLKQAFLDFFNRVSHGSAACGTALARRERIILEDIPQSPIFIGTPALHAMLAADARAVQSTPLISRSAHSSGCSRRTIARPGVRATANCACSTSSRARQPT